MEANVQVNGLKEVMKKVWIGELRGMHNNTVHEGNGTKIIDAILRSPGRNEILFDTT